MKQSTRTSGANALERPCLLPRAAFHSGRRARTSRFATLSEALLPPGTTTVSNTSRRVIAARPMPLTKSRMASATRAQRQRGRVGPGRATVHLFLAGCDEAFRALERARELRETARRQFARECPVRGRFDHEANARAGADPEMRDIGRAGFDIIANWLPACRLPRLCVLPQGPQRRKLALVEGDADMFPGHDDRQ